MTEPLFERAFFAADQADGQTVGLTLQQSQQPQPGPNWLWLPGWGFKAEVFSELARSLPGRHFWYRGYERGERDFQQASQHAVAAIDALGAELARPQEAQNTNKAQAAFIIVGWSLGGALAQRIVNDLAASTDGVMSAAVQGLATLACAPKFCRTERWPHGMDAAQYQAFVDSFKHQPAKTQRRFLALMSQGSANPKALMRALAEQQITLNSDTEASLAAQLSWLDGYDFRHDFRHDFRQDLRRDLTNGSDRDLKTKSHRSCHIFASHDALCDAPDNDLTASESAHAYEQNRQQRTLKTLKGASHGLLLEAEHQPRIREYLLELI